MTDRLGDDGAQTVGSLPDPTARIVSGLLRSRAEPIVHPLTENGDVVFGVPLTPSRITLADIEAMPMANSYSFGDFVGEYLVRKHFRFFEPLVLRNDYAKLVKAHQHLHFGVWFDAGAFRMQCHISALHDIFNRDLRRMLRHESV
jgi:hypothetical protein